jgi:hypothetical protein
MSQATASRAIKIISGKVNSKMMSGEMTVRKCSKPALANQTMRLSNKDHP